MENAINVTEQLNKFDINVSKGRQRAIMAIGDLISTSTDPLATANSVILAFGGNEELSFPEARIKAKAFVERAVTYLDKFDPELAAEYAEAKIVELKGKLPEFKKEVEMSHEEMANSVDTPKRGRPSTKTSSGSNLKADALAICEANSSLSNAQLAGMISKQLEITYANAYYYSSRVFRRSKAS